MSLLLGLTFSHNDYMAFLGRTEKQQFIKRGLNQLAAAARALPHRLLDIILPPKCLKCAARVDRSQSICPDCWKDFHFITDPKCSGCGYPFGMDMGINFNLIGENLCGACQKRPRSFDQAVSALRYDDESRRMVIGFKHHDKTEYAQYFAQLLRQAGSDFLSEADLIVPVPLHHLRLLKRRYNQSALLSRILARDYSAAHVPELLLRTKNTPPQQGNMNKRALNVRGAFKVNGKYRQLVCDKNILLIDDVYTTGSTVETCAKVLKKAGAARVYVLTVFRVISPQSPK